MTNARRDAIHERRAGRLESTILKNRVTNRARILLVEDSPEDVALTLAALEEDGFSAEVTVVNDGEAALAYLHGQPREALPGETPAVVLLDLKMPKLSGLDVLRRIKADQRLRVVPVVMLTSSREERDVAESYACGCNAYVVKHLDFAEFSAALQALATFWGRVNVPPPEAVGHGKG